MDSKHADNITAPANNGEEKPKELNLSEAEVPVDKQVHSQLELMYNKI